MPSVRSCKTKSCTGGSACAPGCKCYSAVRCVGATTHMYEQHLKHAAHGARHIWAAAIVAGLSLALTGAAAFHSAQATSGQRVVEVELVAEQELNQEIQLLKQELQKTLELLDQTNISCESGD